MKKDFVSRMNHSQQCFHAKKPSQNPPSRNHSFNKKSHLQNYLSSKNENKVYDALWQEGYHAKVEREIREKEMRGGLQKKVAITLAEQIRLKDEAEAAEKVRTN